MAYSVYALVATASIALANSLLSFAYWWRRREAAAHLWFCIAMIMFVGLELSRLSQMAGMWVDRPWLPARAVVCALVLCAWATAEFTAAFAGQRPSRAERTVVFALVAVPLLLIVATDLVLTQIPVTRKLWAGEQFVGVEVGPLYFVFASAVVVLWAMGLARLVRGRRAGSKADRYLLPAFTVGFLALLSDFACTVLRIQAPRIGDFAALPIALAFALAEVDRYAELFGELEQKVRGRTRDLAEANAELSRKHIERESLQRRLAEAQRHESLGELASGVAHDFNNLLAVVNSRNELIAVYGEGNAAIEAESARIRAACAGGAALVRQLVTFARKEPAAPKPVDLAEQVHALLPLLEPLAGGAVRLHVETNGPARVLMDPTQFDQILMNLVVNARAAMPDGGELVISVQQSGNAPVQVTVRDTGTGIASEILPRIFEPFFTTKAGHGTGLGLATARRAARDAGGDLSVESEVGVGTTFRIVLPVLHDTD